MEFRVKTVYNQKACASMARALRKTVRKKRSRRSTILGIIVLIAGAALTAFGFEGQVTLNMALTWAAMAAVAIVLPFQDVLNGYIARKRMLKGTESVEAVFDGEGYTTTASAAQSHWKYDNITALADTGGYIVFVFSQLHAQAYDKAGIQDEKSAEDFMKFISERTGLKVQRV